MEPTFQDLWDFGDLMTVEEFIETVKYGGFIPDDGDGLWATKDKQSDISVWDTKKVPKWATHVIWFNK
jgi:hypothetical protein